MIGKSVITGAFHFSQRSKSFRALSIIHFPFTCNFQFTRFRMNSYEITNRGTIHER